MARVRLGEVCELSDGRDDGGRAQSRLALGEEHELRRQGRRLSALFRLQHKHSTLFPASLTLFPSDAGELNSGRPHLTRRAPQTDPHPLPAHPTHFSLTTALLAGYFQLRHCAVSAALERDRRELNQRRPCSGRERQGQGTGEAEDTLHWSKGVSTAGGCSTESWAERLSCSSLLRRAARASRRSGRWSLSGWHPMRPLFFRSQTGTRSSTSRSKPLRRHPRSPAALR